MAQEKFLSATSFTGGLWYVRNCKFIAFRSKIVMHLFENILGYIPLVSELRDVLKEKPKKDPVPVHDHTIKNEASTLT